jgi:hypothetical protein
MSDSEVEDNLKCDVCKDFFYDPITLLCQHTFCSFCITTLKECPMCRLKIHLPKQKNKLITELIGILYGREKLEELNNKFHLTKLEKEIRPQVEKDLRLDFDNMLMDNSKTSPKSSDKIIKCVDFNLNPKTKVEHPKESSIWDFTLENLIKWLELIFVAYYVWILIYNSSGNGFSWIKFLLNVFILIQTFTSMFSFNTQYDQYFSIVGTSNNILSNIGSSVFDI